MTDSDLTIRILREIRDAIEATKAGVNARLDETNARLDQTNARLDKGFQGVVSILRHHEARVIMLGRYVKNRVETRLRGVETRLLKLERKAG